MRVLHSFLRDTQGATAIEYGLIAGLIAMALIVGFGMFTTALTDLFAFIEGKITTP